LHNRISSNDVLGAIPAKEAALINPRTLRSSEDAAIGIGGDDIADQKLWPLSYLEWGTIGNNTVRSYGADYWLRSYRFTPNIHGDDVWGVYFAHDNGSNTTAISGSDEYYAVRPALNLDLSSVLFTSAASGPEAKPASAGPSLSAVSAPTGAIKFTSTDASQTLTVTATAAQSTQSVPAGGSLTFGYRNAAVGANQHISCVLVSHGTNQIAYYGKLADSPSADGTLSVPLSGIVDGVYTLRVFSEQDNGANHTDFAGTPVDMTLTIAGGNGTVADFGGRVLSSDARLLSVAGKSITAGGGTGADASHAKTAEINVANSVAVIAPADIAAAADATFSLCGDSGFGTEITGANTLALTAGGATHAYVKVTSEDTAVTVYYDVTVNRAPPADASLSPASATFNKHRSDVAYKDIAVTLNPGDHLLLAVKNGGGYILQDGADYTVDGNAYTVKKEYLATMDAGLQTFTFDMSGGPDPTLIVAVTDEYPVITDGGAWTGAGAVTVKVDADRVRFVRLLLSGNEVDPANYSVSEGSTVITFKESYLRTFENGTYTFRVEFTDGYADVTFVVKQGETGGGILRTGDSGNLLLWIIVLCSSVSAILLAGRKRRRLKG
jgi:hypothetical protein